MRLSPAQKGLARYLREHGSVSRDDLKRMYRSGTVWSSGTPGPMLRLIKKGLAKPKGSGFVATDVLVMSNKPPKGRITALHANWAWDDPLQ